MPQHNTGGSWEYYARSQDRYRRMNTTQFHFYEVPGGGGRERRKIFKWDFQKKTPELPEVSSPQKPASNARCSERADERVQAAAPAHEDRIAVLLRAMLSFAHSSSFCFGHTSRYYLALYTPDLAHHVLCHTLLKVVPWSP